MNIKKRKNMRVITSQKLFDKYPGHEAELHDLLGQLAGGVGNVDILPIVDYVATKQKCDSITNDSICLVGNCDVIPMPELNNPTEDDDPVVPADQVYFCSNDSLYYIPNKIGSRIPDEQLNPTWDYISTVLKNQIAWKNNKTKNQNWFSIVAKVWNGTGQLMHDLFKMDELNISPTITYQNLKIIDINKKIAYINLHGGNNIPGFYNQQGSDYSVALIPQKDIFNGCFVSSLACYGAQIANRNMSTSICLSAMYNDCVAFLGSTNTAYGGSNAPLVCGDLLSKFVFENLLSGQTVGQALMNGKIQFATDTIKQFGSMNGPAKKTLLSFVLYGNPDIVL